MTLCLLVALIAAALICLNVFFLTDGRVRVAARLVLARRIGGVFAPDVVVVGNSLAAACPWKRLSPRPFAILNLAAGGATIKEIAGQINLAREIDARWLLIDGGLNDLMFDEAGPEQIEADFRALFRRIGADRQVVVTLAPFVSDVAQAPRIEAANRIIARLCAARRYEVVDLNPDVSDGGARLPAMTNDGLHFTAQAENVWLTAVRGAMARAQTRKNPRPDNGGGA